MDGLRVALAQINCAVGDLSGNLDKIKKYAARAYEQGADAVAFPELAVCGYPPEDLLFKPHFIADCRSALDDLVVFSSELPGLVLLVGCVDQSDEGLHNGAAAINNGRILGVYRKKALPNYGVFDEKRYFHPGRESVCVSVNNVRIGLSICEDVWCDHGPADDEVMVGGAQLIINLNASPYHIGKGRAREKLLSEWAVRNRASVGYVNMVGGQDELVFDGHSLVLNSAGELVRSGEQFAEELVMFDYDPADTTSLREADREWSERRAGLDRGISVVQLEAEPRPRGRREPTRKVSPPALELESEILGALKLGVSDYVKKNGFAHVVLGLSGGIDSALTAAIAAEALGAEAVTTVFMPSRFTSTASLEDAAATAEKLGVEMLTVPIEPMFRTYLAALGPVFDDRPAGTAEENLQARIRGNLLMALSNKFNWLLLSTGNKSETSVGYATLYGDMSGGFAVLKDVSKTLAYRLAEFMNSRFDRAVIPKRIITRPPSAELRADQRDSDTLPEYEILDPIVQRYVEDELSVDQIVACGYDRDLVVSVIEMIDGSEYKRRQAPPGVKITHRAFGKDWRLPITNLYQNK